MRRFLPMVLVALVQLVLWATLCNATEYEKETLRGLEGVWVVVDTMWPEVEQAGLTREKIQADVEQQLSRAGIRLLTRKMCIATPGRPQLFVNVRMFRPGNAKSYAYYNSINLRQMVDLERNGYRTLSSTWSRHGAGIVSRKQLGLVRKDMTEMVDLFVAAWLSVNKKP